MRELKNRLLQKLAFVFPGGISMRPALQRLRGVRVGRNVWISQFVYIDEIHPERVSIGDNCTIGIRSSIISHLYWGPRRAHEENAPQVVIEDDVFVGPHCVILPGVRIGRGSVIKAGTVVTRDVPSGVFWGPPPAGPLGTVSVPLTPEHSYEEFMAGIKPMMIRRNPARPLQDEADLASQKDHVSGGKTA